MGKPIQISDCSKVELHIHVLGYYPKGESILVVLWDASDNSVLVSILIDSYQQNKVNRIEPILKQYGIDGKKLDYLVWTHPDLDHSLGLTDIISRYTDKKSKIIVPSGYKMQIFKSFNSDLYKAALSVKSKAMKDKDTVAPVSTSTLYSNSPRISREYVDGFSDSLQFALEILAPFSEHSFHLTEVLKSFNKNDISIAFNIVFGRYKFFFGGDAMNYSIRRIDENRLDHTVFVKIPHHGSPTSDILPEIYYDKYQYGKKKRLSLMTSVSTTFEDHPTHLPDLKVLNKYMRFARKILLTKGVTQNDNFGIWSFKYKLNSSVPKETRQGDASVYFEHP